MCGLAGLVDFGGIDPAVVAARSQHAGVILACRGPDDRGMWSDGHCALAHTRLAIIDLSPLGAQPMHRHGRVIVFNGEIYNHRALRDELISLGHQFESNSDTEVILAGWAQWSEELLPRLNGMFAFVIWDPKSQTCYAARDRFGEKPLLYAHEGGRLAFGSGLNSCEAMIGKTYSVDPAALRAFFTLRFVPEPLSIATSVRKLPAGHVMRFDRNGLAIRQWYDLARQTSLTPASGYDALRDAFDASVRQRLVSDVPVGVFLSGGIDSSLVAASVATSGAKLKTFTVGFEGASNYYEERPLAAAVARHLGADHTTIDVDARRAEAVLDAVFSGLDEPFADSSAIPTYLVSEATRREVKVVLTGDGADEVFGGYRRYWGELYAAAWSKIPTWAHGSLIRALHRLPQDKGNPISEMFRRIGRFVDTADADPIVRQSNWMRLSGEAELTALLGPQPAHSFDLGATVEGLRAAAGENDPINRMLACDVALILPGDMLTKVDRMSMAHGLETRAPFLDHHVVEWAFKAPGQEKLALVGGRPIGKLALRRAFKDRLPAEVFQRPKRGFEVPVDHLLNGGASDRLAWSTDATALKRQGLFNPEVVKRWMDEFRGGKDHSWKLWTLLAFQEWARLHRRPEALGA